MKIETFDTSKVDVQNVRLLKEGMTIARLTNLSGHMLARIVEVGGEAKCDGEDLGNFSPTFHVWLKFSLIREENQLYVIDHSFKERYKVRSENAAREFIRGY